VLGFATNGIARLYRLAHCSCLGMVVDNATAEETSTGLTSGCADGYVLGGHSRLRPARPANVGARVRWWWCTAEGLDGEVWLLDLCDAVDWFSLFR
jgi:hypothetical protein